jgi:putative ABC transport system permease protein
MRLWTIAWRSIQQRALSSSLTGLSMALGVMLVVAVLVAHGVINQSFLNNAGLGYNIVVGAKGGRLELVLNTVYYLARPVENIPYSYYLEFTEGKFKDYTEKAIPLCLGDMYQDYRVIGTTPAFFNELDYGGKKYTFAEGRNFEHDEYYGAVIGATVAREAGLRKGSTFQPSHGVGPEAHVHDPFTVLGVLEPTGTPNDRALFINMEGFYLIPEHDPDYGKPKAAVAEKPATEPHEHGDHDHAHEGHDHSHDHEPLPVERREVTAVLVLTKSIGGAPPELLAPGLIKSINEGPVAQAVLPIREMSSLFSTFVDPMRLVLLSLTVMIVVVSGIGILVSIYNSMSERQHEIAVMRALGAGRQTVMLLVLLESILLSLAGGVAGWVVGHGLIALLSPWISAQTGVYIGFWQFVGYESVIIPGLIALAAVVGYLPAMAAYRTDVAKALSASP